MRIVRPLATLLAACLAAPLSADTLHVPGDAATLESAAELAQPGDRIVLRGKQPPGGTTLTGLVNVEIVGKGGALIDAAEEEFGLALFECSGVTVRGLRVANSGSHGVFVAGSSGIELDRLRIDDAGFVGLLLAASSDVRVTRLRVNHSSGASVSASECTDVELDRARIVDSGGHAIFLFDSRRVLVDRPRVSDSAGHGLLAQASQELEILRGRYLRNGGSGLILEGEAGESLASLVRQNTVRDTGLDGIRVAGELVTVERNRVRDVPGVGLSLSGLADGNLVSELNRISKTGSHGLVLGSPDQTSLDDRVRGTGGHGALVAGDGQAITDLRVSQCALDGVHVLPAEVPFFIGGLQLTDLRISKVGGDGLVVEPGTGAMEVSGCRVKAAQGHGILVQDPGGTYEDNRVRGSGLNGIDVSSGSNLFRDNSVRGSSGVDLNDHPPDGQSNFFLGNDFGTGQPAPL